MVWVRCDLGRAAVTLSLVPALLLDTLTLGHLYTVAVLQGICMVFFNLADVSALPKLVATVQLPQAIAQNQGRAFWVRRLPVRRWAPGPLLLGAAFAVLMFCGPVCNVVQSSRRLAMIPDGLQGRVNSAFRFAANVLYPLAGGASRVVRREGLGG